MLVVWAVGQSCKRCLGKELVVHCSSVWASTELFIICYLCTLVRSLYCTGMYKLSINLHKFPFLSLAVLSGSTHPCQCPLEPYCNSWWVILIVLSFWNVLLKHCSSVWASTELFIICYLRTLVRSLYCTGMYKFSLVPRPSIEGLVHTVSACA